MEKLIEELQEQLEEEHEDIAEYHRLAKCAEDHGENDLAIALTLIAKDEKTHADYLEKYLHNSGYKSEEHLKKHI